MSAIFAADVAGYSRLVGLDEEGTLGRFKNYRASLIDPKIAAVDIQLAIASANFNIAATQRVELRIGIHVGDIVSDDGDIFGDGVNIAARLEALAIPGGICVSARVQEESRVRRPKEIARNVQQAAHGTQQVSSNITDVQRGASETGSASSQVLAAAKSLSDESTRLKREVGKFSSSVRAA